MKLKVKASSNYDILIKEGISNEINKIILNKFNKCKVLIVTDSNVPSSYYNKVANSLNAVGFNCFIYTIASGESSKNIDNYINIQNYLAEKLFSRKDIIIAVGGGVVGDLAGFVASTYMRGIKFVNMPTTLLACIDSSVGGKTAINLESGKNLVGTFYQPSLVVIDTLFLESLPKKIFDDGLGEAIKYAILDKKVWEVLKGDINDNLELFIYQCLLVKKKIVEKDEKESGLRQVLNLGHTFGHAIEKFSNFSVSHGVAVLKGIVLMLKYAVKNNDISQETYESILRVIRKYNLDFGCDYNLETLKQIILIDKKATNGFVNLVCIKDIGKVYIQKIKIDEIEI